MAKAPRSTTIDPEAQYRVKLSRPVRDGLLILRPRDDVVVKGKRIEALGDAVASFEKL